MKAIVTCNKCGHESKTASLDEFKFARKLLEMTDKLFAHDEICQIKKFGSKKKNDKITLAIHPKPLFLIESGKG